jgi:hypothetical protein
MKPVVFRYGIYTALAIVALGIIQFFIVMPNVTYETAEIAGYLTMILSMVFVFAGIRYYRDHVNNGSLTFVQGLKIGTLIVLIPAVAFALFDILYTEVLNPSWGDDYYKYYLQKLKDSTPADQLEKELKKLENNKEMFSNPVYQFLLMAGTVFVIGFIVTIISSLTLRRIKTAASA